MTARTGKPLRLAKRLDDYSGTRQLAHYEIHHPADGTELVVCGDCGFEWDAVHTVRDDQGRTGYECPRCVMQAFVAARQRVIEDTVRRGGRQLAQTLRLQLTRLEAACLAGVAMVRSGQENGVPDGSWSAMQLLQRALWSAGFNIDSIPRPVPSAGRVAAAIAWARQEWRQDGAEGETVHLLCDELERLTGMQP